MGHSSTSAISLLAAENKVRISLLHLLVMHLLIQPSLELAFICCLMFMSLLTGTLRSFSVKLLPRSPLMQGVILGEVHL